MNDPAYFARKHLKVISLDDGLVPFDLYPYQEEMFDHFKQNRFTIVLACRQSGKSISSVGYILWYAVFHPEKTIAVFANKGAARYERCSRVSPSRSRTYLSIYSQEAKALNKGSLEFSNNSKDNSSSNLR